MSIAGSPRYSSPEVLLHHPYGKGHDVWSFSLVVWELLSLQQPFAGCKDFEELARTIVLKKERPSFDSKSPRTIKDLLRESLSVDHSNRPSMSAIRVILERSMA